MRRWVRKRLDVRRTACLLGHMEKCCELEQLMSKSPEECDREAEGHLRMNDGDF